MENKKEIENKKIKQVKLSQKIGIWEKKYKKEGTIYIYIYGEEKNLCNCFDFVDG